MKLSDLMAEAPASTPEGPPLPYPRSTWAEPPISIAEAQRVDLARDTTNCRHHGGETSRLVDGRVYFCGSGRMYFRHSKQQGGMHSRLDFGSAGWKR